MTAPIADLLSQIEAPGTFATRLRARADELDIEVAGVGRLRYPITPQAAQKLRGVARPSPYGLREQTLHDPSVRNSLEISASQVKIAARSWKPALAKHLRKIQADLGLPDECELKAELDKLLLYEAGQFFKSHQDSEKSDDMVATLVVVLPSEYSGGVLTVEHRGRTKAFRHLESQAEDLSLFAFYADCLHAVSPIKSGVRLVLTYRLSLEGRAGDAPTSMRGDLMDRLTERVREHFAVPVAKPYATSEPAPPERLVYLLDHEYTQRSLSWSHLKHGDRVRVGALRTAAQRLDCESLLALAEVHETWTCEEEYDGYGYGHRGWRSRQDYDEDHDDEADDEAHDVADDHALVDLEDSTIELHHWLDVEGKHIKGISGSVSDDELHCTMLSRDLEPFRSEHEGYQGNYGNTVDRWYHRAAFVMWPRANTFALRAQASPQWAVEQLLALPRADTAELERRVKTLLPRWAGTAGSVEGASFFAKLIKLSTRIDDAAIAREWLSPLGAHRLRSQTMRRDLVLLVDKHGLPWAQELFASWTQSPDWGVPAWAPLLAHLCEDLCASKCAPCEALARWLVEREIAAACKRCVAMRGDRQAWLELDAFADESIHLAHVFAAAVAASALSVLEGTTSFLLDEQQRLSTAFLVQLLQDCISRSPALRTHITGSPLHRVCVERLEAALQAPVRALDDWAITHPLNCGCADCKELSKFLRSPRAEYDWPLSEGRRQHIHSTIDSAKLPVLHTTLRRGRPFILQLRKDRSLFSREETYRARLKKILSELPALRPR